MLSLLERVRNLEETLAEASRDPKECEKRGGRWVTMSGAPVCVKGKKVVFGPKAVAGKLNKGKPVSTKKKGKKGKKGKTSKASQSGSSSSSTKELANKVSDKIGDIQKAVGGVGGKAGKMVNKAADDIADIFQQWIS